MTSEAAKVLRRAASRFPIVTHARGWHDQQMNPDTWRVTIVQQTITEKLWKAGVLRPLA